jgi:NAD(P)-dependent dehydrogenase (short-subunit alcohol dehydrogenase family)
MDRLAGKTAIITGASSGIGRAAALLFAQQGANLVLTGRDTDRLHNTARLAGDCGAAVEALAGDVRGEALHEALVATALRRFGSLHIAFNNAGTVGAMGSVETLSLADWHETIDTNLTGAFLAARAQVPALIETGGAILFTSSFVGTSVGIAGMAAYGASKAALMGLVKGLTADHGAQGLRANALIVGGTDTAMAGSAEQKQWAAGLHALKRIAQPEEIARAALFLASEMSSFVAGSALYVDGGNAAVK